MAANKTKAVEEKDTTALKDALTTFNGKVITGTKEA